MFGKKILWIFIFIGSLMIAIALNYQVQSTSLREIAADNSNFQYLGRIDRSTASSPIFAYPATACQFNFEGTTLQLKITEDNWGNHNYIGVYLDDNPEPIVIELETSSEPRTYEVVNNLSDTQHRALMVKRTDFFTGEFSFQGIVIDHGKNLLPPDPISSRRMEVYGDSITVGGIVESDNVGEQDPPGNNKHLDNSYASFGAMLAQDYQADFHLIAQSGIALTNGYGYWFEGTGMESVYDKYKPLPNARVWNFNNYQPDLIIIALGQNDSASVVGKEEISGEQWKKNYQKFIINLREEHPQAYFICMFPNMFHDPVWDTYLTEAVNQYRQKFPRAKVYSLITEQVTPGHPRVSEQRLMADALKNLINNTLINDGFSWQ
ncbi:MAG: GDSL-type esterase/lipase family protein [Pleurocapsa sp.]